jgi:D-sedoheptulose 7-phosphate isomerase
MKAIFKKHTKELQDALADTEEFHQQIVDVVTQLKAAFAKGKHVYVAGNGGSAAESQHLAEEFVGRYKSNRPSYPAISLTADSTALTCIANDFGYEQVFARQIEGLGKEGDIFIGLSTSGNSPNILAAAEAAKDHGMTVIALTGQKGKFKDIADYAILAPAGSNARIQELHLHAIHLICEAFEPENMK